MSNTNTNGNGNGKVYYNKGYLFRGSQDPVGVSGKSDSLELYVYDVKQTTVSGTGEPVLELSTSGHFNRNNGIDYVLGEDAYSDRSNGLIYIKCTAWGAKKDRLLQLNVRKGFVLRIYGKFEKQTFTRQDGTPGTAVVCKNVQQFEIIVWPKDENGGTQIPAPAPAPQGSVAPAPAPAAPMNPPTQAAPAPVPQNSATPTTGSNADINIPF